MLIEQIQVKGYKSLVDATLHVKPLTLLAGTNSSGKSSIMQPLLLIKQTNEAFYQPAGALVLDGAHVRVETADELVSKIPGSINKGFSIQFDASGIVEGEWKKHKLIVEYQVQKSIFEIKSQRTQFGVDLNKSFLLTPTTKISEIVEQAKKNYTFLDNISSESKIKVRGGFIQVDLINEFGNLSNTMWHSYPIDSALVGLMHIPGLRINPKRNYPVTFFQDQIKGTFDLYTAGTISQWQQQENTTALNQLNDSLRRLNLTDSVTAEIKNANEVELSINRLPVGAKTRKKSDMVNIADVGIGVSQVLPILVALIAAQEGQIVYIEQPELHLHPRAQVAMAELLAEAANRGVRVIVETHSSLLLLTIQTLIAQEKIANTDVALHWFARDAKGATHVTYVQPDEDGAYGEWPEDFGDVELKAQDAYLTAVGMRHFGKGGE